MTQFLSKGSIGDGVRNIQYFLNTVAQFGIYKFNTKAPLLSVDGIFGPKTTLRVVEFQSRQNILADGIVGPITQNLINVAMDVVNKIIPPPVTGTYNRMAAIIYAGTFHNRITSDARVSTKFGYPRTINGVVLTPGIPFTQTGRVPAEEDCTHFISCCIGRPPPATINGISFRGGGLALQTAHHMVNAGAYGRDYVADLIGHLTAMKFGTIIGPQFRSTDLPVTRQEIISKLRPGDLLAYSSKANVNNYEHFVILVGPSQVACHTYSRFGHDFASIAFPWVSLIKLP